MYTLPHYKEKDPEKVIDFVKAHTFAFLTGCDKDNKPVVTQIPMFIDKRDDKLFLSGHMMKNTDHHKAFLHNSNALAVFTGPHSYISASWYENKQQASTWNYMSVHARGELVFSDEAALIDILKRTTDHFENDPHSGANFKDIPQDYIAKLVNAIEAFEIEVTQLDHVFKLSQNRDEKSYVHIIDQLKKQDGDGAVIATEMEKRSAEIFHQHPKT